MISYSRVPDKRPSPLIFFWKFSKPLHHLISTPTYLILPHVPTPHPQPHLLPPLISTPHLLRSHGYVQSALLILFFHNKLLFYNDIE